MNYEAGPSINPAPAQFEYTDWQSCRDIIRSTYQRSPWMPGAIWEFTPRNGIVHICGCGLCINFKEHLLVAGAVDTVNPSESSAWKIQDNYKEDLIHLGWGLAYKGGRVPQSSKMAALLALHQRNHHLNHQLQMLCTQNEHTVQWNNELMQELKLVHASTQQGEHLPQPEANVITSLREQIVFKSPVQSGLLTIFGMDLDLDRSRPFLKWYRLRLDRFGPVQSSPKQSIDQSRPVHGLDWSRLVSTSLWTSLDWSYPTLINLIIRLKRFVIIGEQLGINQKQLGTGQKQLGTDQKQLRTDQKQLRMDQKQLRTDQKQLRMDQKQLRTDQKQLGIDQKQLGTQGFRV